MSLLNKLRSGSHAINQGNAPQTPGTDEQLKILIAGEINAGKSSLINALIGDPILPAKLVGHTAAIHYCLYSPHTYCRVYFKDDSKHPQDVPAERSALEAFMDDAGQLVRHIEVGHPKIPPEIVLIDTPGINDPDPYRNTLVTAFMTASDAMIFTFDVNTPLKSTEVTFLDAHLKKYRLASCLFVANKADIDFSERDLSQTHSIFFESLQKYISPKISPDQAIIVSARASDVDDPEGHISPDKLIEGLNRILKQKVDIIAKRSLRASYISTVSSLETCRATHALASKDRDAIEDIVRRHLSRGKALLQTHEELHGDRDDFLNDVDQNISTKFANVSEAIEALLVYPPDQFEKSASQMVADAVEDIKGYVAHRANRSCIAISFGGADFTDVAATYFSSQRASREKMLATERDSTLLKTGTDIAAVIATQMLHFHPLVGLAIMGWGIYSSTNKISEGAASFSDGRDAARKQIQIRLNNTQKEIIGFLATWYDNLCDESTRNIRSFLFDLCAVTSVETDASLTPGEIHREITKLEVECARLLSALGETP